MAPKPYKLEKYGYSVEAATNKLLKEYQLYQVTPENHPSYNKEWKKFWERRYKEIKREGNKDPKDHDYTSEWIGYWKRRMKQILDDDIEKIKRNRGHKSELPIDYEPVIGVRKLTKASDFPSKSEDQATNKRRQLEYEEITSDSDSDSYYGYSRRSYHRKQPRYESPRSYNDRVHYTSPYRGSRPDTSSYDSTDNTENISIITVCRLLSALETELGCFSQKVLDLLSQAIALNKLKPNCCDEILMSADNVLFLNTVKEKLKGLVMVGVLPPLKISVIKRCIQKIAKLVHSSSVKKPVMLHEEPVEADEKTKLSEEISKTLKDHGVENCTPEELEVLVEIYYENETEEIEEVEKIEVLPSCSNNESLTDEDLKILLSNFAELKMDEQSQVIRFLSDMERTDRARVDSLRKYVKHNEMINNMNDDDSDDYNINQTVSHVMKKIE